MCLGIRRYGLLRKVEKNDKKKQVLVILSSIKYKLGKQKSITYKEDSTLKFPL